jgi:Na+/melibiose symporter-like transporter
MRLPQTVSEHRHNLFAYAMPAIPLAFLGLPLYVHLPAHYAELPGIGLATVGVVLLLARLVDLVTDPLVGLLADRTRARLRPQWLMTVGAALLLFGVGLLFRPDEHAGALFLFLALTVTYLGWTLLAIPYYALGAEVGEQRGQTHVAAWREAGMIAGTLLALLLPVAFGATDTLDFSATVLLWLVPIALVAAWMIRAGAVSAAIKAHATGLMAMWHETSRPARQVLSIHLLNTLAGGTAATLFLIFTREALGLDERAAGMLLLLYFVVGLAALPLWVRVARRIGEVRAWRAAMLLAAAGFVPAAFLGNGDVLAFALVCVVTGATLGADIALPAALQARLVVDESRTLDKPRGGALFGLWGMASKLALALSAGLALPLLAWLASPETARSQGDVVPWLYAGLPVFIKLFAVLALQRSVLMPAAAGAAQDTKEVSDDVHPPADSHSAINASRRV